MNPSQNNFPSYNNITSPQHPNNFQSPNNAIRSPSWQNSNKRMYNNWGNNYRQSSNYSFSKQSRNNQYSPNNIYQNNSHISTPENYGDRFSNRNYPPRQNTPNSWGNSPNFRGRRYNSPNYRGQSPRHGFTPRFNQSTPQHQQNQPVEIYFKATMLQDPWSQLRQSNVDSMSQEEISS